MSYPENLKYTKDHEWVKVEGDTALVGITHFAQSELGDVVFIDLPALGKTVKQKDTLCVVESTKAASDVYSPISGTVKEINSALASNPEKINSDPYNSAWMVRLEKINTTEIENLMNAQDYKKHIGV